MPHIEGHSGTGWNTDWPEQTGANDPYDWSVFGGSQAGSLTMLDLLPEGLTDAYDISPFADLFGAEFDTGLMDITKRAGRQDIFNAIGSGQTSYMQTPSGTALAGAGGFGEAGGGARGLVTAEGAQRGLFGDVFEATLGAEKANLAALESLKDRAFDMFTNIQLDLDPSNNNNDNVTNPGDPLTDNNNTFTMSGFGYPIYFNPDGTPITPSQEGDMVQYGDTIWVFMGGGWSIAPGQDGETGETGDNGDNGDNGGDTGTTTSDGDGGYNPPTPPAPRPGGGGGGCFLAGTMILTGDGTEIPIENIEKGMEVYAFDKESGELRVSKVSETFFHPKENTYLIVNDNLLVTPNHPVLNNNKWVEIGELEEGDTLTDRDNNPIPISKIEEVNELSDVFNFEVEKYHTYVAEGIIVHNKELGFGGGDSPGGEGEGGGSLYNWTWDDNNP